MAEPGPRPTATAMAARRAVLHGTALWVLVSAILMHPGRADPAGGPGTPSVAADAPGAALRRLQETLALDGDNRAIVDARIQIDAMVKAQENVQAQARLIPRIARAGAGDSTAAAIGALSARLDAVIAALPPAGAAAQPPPHQAVAPVTAWLMAPLGGAPALVYGMALACLAALIAAFAAVLAGKRLSNGHEAAQDAMLAAGKSFEAAARRFTRTQDEASAAAETASDAASQAGKAASRLAIASQESESRLRACIDEVEARLRGAGSQSRQFEQAAAGLPALLADSVAGITARGVQAIEDAAAALRESAGTVTGNWETETRALPALLADAILAVAARGLPAMEAATEKLTARAEAAALAADLLPGAGQAVRDAVAALALAASGQDAGLARIEVLAGLLPDMAGLLSNSETQLRHLADEAAAQLHGGAETLGRAAHAVSETVQGAQTQAEELAACIAQLPHAAAALADSGAFLQQEAVGLADAALVRDANADQFAGWVRKCLADLPEIAAGLDSTASRMEAALHGSDKLGEAVAASASLPDTASLLAEAANRLHGEAASALLRGNEALMAVSRASESLAGMPQAAGSLEQAALRIHAVLDQEIAAMQLADEARAAQAAHSALVLEALSARADAACVALPAEAASLADAAREIANGSARLNQTAKQISNNAALQEAVSHETQRLLAQIEAATARVAASAETKENATVRVLEAAHEVTVLAAGKLPPHGTGPVVNLARLNGLAAEATMLQAQADRLAAAALRGGGQGVPTALLLEAPSLLAAIETSIQRLRGAANALSMASDAGRQVA